MSVLSSSYALTASYVDNAQTASYVLNAVSASYALTASLALNTTLLDGRSSSTFANTGSNTFTGPQYVSDVSNAISFTSTASLYTDGGARITKDLYVSGTTYLNNLTVFGSASIEYVTSSVLVGLEFINLNTDLPALRYAGINVGDSGSAAGISSSFWYDSEKDNWLYVHAHYGASETSSLAINGPIAYNNLGNEQGLTANYITKAQLVSPDNNHHITSSQIYDDGTTVAIAGNLQVTGSLYAGNLTGSLFGTSSYALTASFVTTAQTASFVVSSSYALSASYALSSSLAQTASYVENAQTASFVTTAQTASYVLQAVSSSYALTASYAANVPTTASYALTASYVETSQTASYVLQAVSASYALTASYAANVPTTASYALTASYVETSRTASYVLQAVSSSYASFAETASYVLNPIIITGSNAILNQTSPATTWSFNHNLNTQYPIFQVFNTANEVIIPQNIIALTTTSSLIYFPYALAGTAVASVGGYTGSITASFCLSASYAATASYVETAQTASYVLQAVSSSYALSASYAPVSGFPFTGSAQITGSLEVTGSLNVSQGITGSLLGTASTASYVLQAVSASYATTASFATNATNFTASNILVNGTITAQTLVVQTITASIEYSSGSNIFGSLLTDTQQLTGSVTITGSLNVNTLQIASTLLDYGTVTSSIVGSNNVFTRNTGSFTSAFYQYTVSNSTNSRAGQVYAVWNAGNTSYTDVATLDLGSTTPVTASVDIVSGQVQLNFQTNTSGWAIKSTVTYI